jgi:hypothetical protein
MAASTYDPRTAVLLPRFNALLARHFLPTLSHPAEATPSLLTALYESLIESRIASINRRDKATAAQIRNVKLLLGEMVMAGWDVGAVDPQGVVEREESCVMDIIEVFVEIGKDKYGMQMNVQGEEAVDAGTRNGLGTISEGESSDDSVSTITGIHERAEDILTRIHELNPNLRPSSPTETTISRGTQTSPPPSRPTIHLTPRPRRPKHTPQKRIPSRKREKAVQTDDDTESGIPSSIPLSYSSTSSMGSPTFPKPPFYRFKSLQPQSRHPPNRSIVFSPLRQPHLNALPLQINSPLRPRFRYTSSSSSSSEGFRVDSPYTAALRRRRRAAIDTIRKHNPRKPRIRVFSRGKDPGDSTFAEDSDASPLPHRISARAVAPVRDVKTEETGLRREGSTRRVVEEDETTDGLTDLERRVCALKIWGGIEEERKDWLLSELQRKKRENSISLGVRSRGRSASVSSGSGSSGSVFSFIA